MISMFSVYCFFFFSFVQGILCNHLKCLLKGRQSRRLFFLRNVNFCVEIKHAKATLLKFKFHVCTITLFRLEYVHFQLHCQNVTTNFQTPSLPNSLLFNAS
uniref:Secreted protein n=1 Tax=Ixodes scapularis TaxID=6945 RepID=A0A4D5RGN3_IXOSC